MSGTSSRVIVLPLVIASGQTVSTIARGWKSFGGSAGLTIYSPATLPETVNIQVSWEELDSDDETATWFNWFDGGPPTVQQTTPLAGNASPYALLVTTRSIRLVATGAVDADRTFYLSFQATN